MYVELFADARGKKRVLSLDIRSEDFDRGFAEHLLDLSRVVLTLPGERRPPHPDDDSARYRPDGGRSPILWDGKNCGILFSHGTGTEETAVRSNKFMISLRGRDDYVYVPGTDYSRSLGETPEWHEFQASISRDRHGREITPNVIIGACFAASADVSDLFVADQHAAYETGTSGWRTKPHFHAANGTLRSRYLEDTPGSSIIYGTDNTGFVSYGDDGVGYPRENTRYHPDEVREIKWNERRRRKR